MKTFNLINTRVWGTAFLLLAIHAGLMAYSATRYSPALDEPGHLVAGLSHWKFGRFELYRVNPPLVRMVAAIPVAIHGYEEDWSDFAESPGQRPEFAIGTRFIENNGADSIWLFTIARWACIPFSLVGGLFCFLWSRELWGNNLAGLISLTLWCFDPNILGYGALIIPDCAATAFGLMAFYFFWKWLKKPGWGSAVIAGLTLGAAQLTKMTWVVGYGLYPALWSCWLFCRKPATSCLKEPRTTLFSSAVQLASILAISLLVINMGYGFDGAFPTLGEQKFVSKAFAGEPGTVGNRFRGTLLGKLYLPVPTQYLLGMDVQKRDFESHRQQSYLRGEWKQGGWWYYYIYGALVKCPHGTQMLLGLGTLSLLRWRNKSLSGQGPELKASRNDVLLLLAPAITVFVVVSSHLTFNHHFRYVLPAFGFVFVFAGSVSMWFLTPLQTHGPED